MNNDFFATPIEDSPANPPQNLNQQKKPLGYDQLIVNFTDNLKANNLPAVHLFEAPLGSGKRCLSEYLAAELLGTTSSQYSELSLHPDLLIIDHQLESGVKKEISIATTRKIKDFLQLTAAQSNNKVVIIDCLDKLNHAAANSILKILEEPPANCYFLLVCHNSANILATINSRCQKITLPRLSKIDIQTILQEHALAEDLEILYELFPYQPGEILRFHENEGLNLLKKFSELVEAQDKAALKAAISALDFSKKPELFGNFQVIFHHIIYQQIKEDLDKAQLISELHNFLNDFYDLFAKTQKLNLDKKNFLINSFFNLMK